MSPRTFPTPVLSGARRRSLVVGTLAVGLCGVGVMPVTASAASARASLTASTPKPVSRNHTATIRVTVTNRAGARLSGLTLSAARPSGTSLSVSGAKKGRLTRTLATLSRGKHTTVSLRVKPGSRAKATSKVTVSLRQRGKLVARTTPVVRLKGAPDAPKSPYAGRYFWRSTYNGTTSYLSGYYFSNDGFAYRGIPKGGLPDCRAATAPGEEDGCVGYALDSAGAISVAGKPGALTGPHLLKVADDTYEEAAIPTAGTRWALSGQYINAYGICPLACTFVSVGLKLTAGGTFARSTAVSGSTLDADFAALPPDKHGTYEVQAGGRIVFTYANGAVSAETVGVLLNKADAPDPNFGLILDDSVFFGPNSDV